MYTIVPCNFNHNSDSNIIGLYIDISDKSLSSWYRIFQTEEISENINIHNQIHEILNDFFSETWSTSLI